MPARAAAASAQRHLQSAGEAVRVAGRVTALEPDLVDPAAAKFVAVREESDVGDKTARGEVGVKLRHPCSDAVGIKDLVPRRVQRVGDVDPSAVTADLYHLRSAAEQQGRSRRVRLASYDPSDVDRCRLSRVEWVADVVLLDFARAPA